MNNYIRPQIIKYQNIDDLLKNNNKASSFFGPGEDLSIEGLIQEDFVCVVGEPGIGKTRLVDEIKNQITDKLYQSTASQFKQRSIPEDIKYCIIDALDEVDGNIFYSLLQSIKTYKEDHPTVKVLFTCRKHYVASYAKHLASCNDLIYVELCRLREEDVMGVVESCSEAIR